MIVEWYALKCFSLGAFITGVGFMTYIRWTYKVKVFEIVGISLKGLKKP